MMFYFISYSLDSRDTLHLGVSAVFSVMIVLLKIDS